MAPRSAVAASAEGTTAKADAGRFVPEPMVVQDYKKPVMGDKYKGLLGDNFIDQPLMKRLNWLHVPLLASIPIIGLYGLLTVPLRWQTLLLSIAYYVFSGIGITGGYHRLFAHKAYTATKPLRIFLMLAGSAAVEGSIKWWSHGHRAHHKYVDTDKDPYAATKGFWYAHIGWMLVRTDKHRIGRTSIDDLLADPIVRFQHKYYIPIALVMSFVLPTLIAGLGWGDYAGGYFYAGVIRLCFVHHSTFFVNSLAHFAGDAVYTDRHTARNSFITALLTLGEGYHNFHHEFPSDYRNGIEWYQYDPTKVFIRLMEILGLASNLQRFPHNEIQKGRIQMAQAALDEERARLARHPEAAAVAKLERAQKALDVEKQQFNWGPDPAALPVCTKDDVASRVKAGESLVILDGFVLDVSKFKKTHPGGEKFLGPDVMGSDITASFKEEVYRHSQAARNLAATLRVARVQGYWS